MATIARLSEGKFRVAAVTEVPLLRRHTAKRRDHPEWALEISNLQVLGAECNHGQGNWDQTDWRHQ